MPERHIEEEDVDEWDAFVTELRTATVSVSAQVEDAAVVPHENWPLESFNAVRPGASKAEQDETVDDLWGCRMRCADDDWTIPLKAGLRNRDELKNNAMIRSFLLSAGSMVGETNMALENEIALFKCATPAQ